MQVEETAFDIPHDGSLGLLAYGYIGLLAWRQARKKYELETGKKIRYFHIETKNEIIEETSTKGGIENEQKA
ncbi:MAG TPA: hypothetical protein PKO18_08220 [Chitinophagales bacterium]|nr:hypothetical protein [Chitinophagales bacterium]